MTTIREHLLATTTLADNDYIRVVKDPLGTFTSKNLPATELKAYLKVYFDGIYRSMNETKYAATNISVTSSTTLVPVPNLAFTLASGKKYIFTIMLFTTCAAGGGVKTSVMTSDTLTATSIVGTTIMHGPSHEALPFTALNTSIGETAVDYLIQIEGYIEVNAGGTLLVKFAQNASNGTASTVYAGSWMSAKLVG